LWSWAFWLLFFGFLPAAAYVRSGVFIAAWMIAFMAVGYFKTNFDCPRCGKTFFKKFDDRPGQGDWWNKPWARHCLHCGLKKWATNDAE
jgi:hypothetical protein